jgi:primary-amine oxidase
MIHKTLPNKDGHWTDAEPEDRGISGRELPSPLLVQPYGPRVEIDVCQNYVKWMGWEFYLAFSQVTSLSLFDIRFRGERVMYELAFQEALAHYAGSSPALAGQAFFDTLFGFGVTAYELVPGYDCPAYATYLPITWYRSGQYFKRKNAICVFEAVSDHLLQRHTTGQKVTASKNSYLVVRTVSTVGNYDYTVSYHFYLDGSIEVKVHASGYIFTDYLALEDMRKDLASSGETQITEYGYRVHDVVVSSMHTHELLFKADLDVAGTENTLYRVAFEPLTRKYPFEDEERHSMHLIHTPVTSEAGLDWTKNSQGVYVVLNNASENTWGEKRGYRIVPGTGMGSPPHLAMSKSTAMGNAAGWAFHNLWVLKQHDEELRGASEWNSWETDAPLIDFNKMVDSEPTVQEDLVFYFNLGVHHLSNSQDIPNTLMHWAGTSVMFVPHNYFDRDPSRESAHGVRLKMERGKKGNNATYYGPKYDKAVHIRKVRDNLFGSEHTNGG